MTINAGAWGEFNTGGVNDPCFVPQAVASMVMGRFDEPADASLYNSNYRSDYSPFNCAACINVHIQLATRNATGSAHEIEVGVGYSHMLKGGGPQVFTYVCHRSLGGLGTGTTYYRGPLRAPIRGQEFKIKRRSSSDPAAGYQCYERGRKIGPVIGVGYSTQDSVRSGFWYDSGVPNTAIPPTIMKLYLAFWNGVKRNWPIGCEPVPSDWVYSGGCIPPDCVTVWGFKTNDPNLCWYYGKGKSEVHLALRRGAC